MYPDDGGRSFLCNVSTLLSDRLCGITSQAVSLIISNVLQVWQRGGLELGCSVLRHGWFNTNGSSEQSKDDRDSIWISTDKEASGVWWWLPANWKCVSYVPAHVASSPFLLLLLHSSLNPAAWLLVWFFKLTKSFEVLSLTWFLNFCFGSAGGIGE